MPGTTRIFGIILILLGVASYALTGRTSVTALIPAFFGAVLLVLLFVPLALALRAEGASRLARRLSLSLAVTLGLGVLLVASGLPLTVAPSFPAAPARRFHGRTCRPTSKPCASSTSGRITPQPRTTRCSCA